MIKLYIVLADQAGLLGGAVYVNAFTLISRHVDPLLREFSLAAASLGDSLGIAFADIAGILIQVSIARCTFVCLYNALPTLFCLLCKQLSTETLVISSLHTQASQARCSRDTTVICQTHAVLCAK